MLCGIWAFLSMKQKLRRVAGWSAQHKQSYYVGLELSY